MVRVFRGFPWYSVCRVDPMPLYEVRHAARSLLRVPSTTAISVLTVALGVGAGTALFTVMKAVLLNPLPYADSSRLAWAAEIGPYGGEMAVRFQNFLDWRNQNRTFSAMAAFEEIPTVVAGTVGATSAIRIRRPASLLPSSALKWRACIFPAAIRLASGSGSIPLVRRNAG